MIKKLSGNEIFGKGPDYVIASGEVGWKRHVTCIKDAVTYEIGFLTIIVRYKDIICRMSKADGVFTVSDPMAVLLLSDIDEVKPEKKKGGEEPYAKCIITAVVFSQTGGRILGHWPFKIEGS
ncbi:MAG: hypothetical protein MJ014_00150 [Methanocorpusculum sp.]|nr:hypothetical protein [Methanocorpusculum sp.]